MLPIQNAESSKALAAGLGLKGRIRLSIDEVEVAVVLVDDFTGSPYSTTVPLNSARRQPGVAAEFSGVGLEPVAGSILVIDRITVENDTGSDAEYELRVMTAAEIAAVNTVATGTSLHLNHLFGANGAPFRAGALGRSFSDDAIAGAVVERLGVLDNSQGVIILPSGFALYGDDPFGPNGLALWGTTVQEPVSANFYGRQFLNKG